MLSKTERMVWGGWGCASLGHLFTYHPSRNWLYRGGSLTTADDIGLYPLVGTSGAKLTIWSERLAKGPYQKITSSVASLEPAMHRGQDSSIDIIITLH